MVLWKFIESQFVESLLYRKFITSHLHVCQISGLSNICFDQIHNSSNFLFVKQAANLDKNGSLFNLGWVYYFN